MPKKITVLILATAFTFAGIIPAFAEEPPEVLQEEPAAAEAMMPSETEPPDQTAPAEAPEQGSVDVPETAAPEDAQETVPEEITKSAPEDKPVDPDVPEDSPKEEPAEETSPVQEVKPEVTSVSIKDTDFCTIRVKWTCSNTDRVKLQWAETKDFKESKTSIYNVDSSPEIIVSVWKPVYVKLTPVKNNTVGEPVVTSSAFSETYKPGKLELSSASTTIGRAVNVKVLDKAGRAIPARFYSVHRPSREVIGPNKGYVTFRNEYSRFQRMNFTYTAYPPKPGSLSIWVSEKNQITVRIEMSGAGRYYDYAEIVYANNPKFKNWKAVKVTGNKTKHVQLKNLKPNTTYYARAKYVKKLGKKVYKSEYVPLTMRTTGNPPWPTYASATTRSLVAQLKRNRNFTFKFPQPLSFQDASQYETDIARNFPQYMKYDYSFCMNKNCDKIIGLKFTYSKRNAARANRMKAKIDSITRYARKKGSYWKQVEYVNWRMKKMCAYDWSAYYSSDYRKYEDSYNAYGCLVKGRAVCSGYADAFNAIMVELNIPSKIVMRNDHEWNIVRIGKKWYHVDVTWNDCTGSNAYLLTRNH